MRGADANPAGLAESRENFPETEGFADYRGMLRRKDIGAVFISAPDFLGRRHADNRGSAFFNVLAKPRAASEIPRKTEQC